MSNTLYRMFDSEDRLLYVGITNNPVFRFREHRTTKEWWTAVARISLTHYSSRKELDAAERAAVKAESPVWNVVRFTGPVVRERRDPPMIRLSAVRESVGITRGDLHRRFAGAFSMADIEAFERGRAVPEGIAAAYEEALGLCEGSISTTYVPRNTPATSEGTAA